MDFGTRFERFQVHVDRRPRTNVEAFRAFVLHAQLYALGQVDEPPPEATYNALAGAYGAQASVAPYDLEQMGLLVESAWQLALARGGSTDATAFDYGVLTPLPDDFPYREMLAKDGIDTVEALRGCDRQTVTDVNGIGESRLEDVYMALSALGSASGEESGTVTPLGGEQGAEMDAQALIDGTFGDDATDEDPAEFDPPPDAELTAPDSQTIAEQVGAEPGTAQAEGDAVQPEQTVEGGDPEYLDPSDPYSGPMAEQLAAGSLLTNAEVYGATDEQLVAVKGVGKGSLTKIREHFERGS